MFDKSNNIDWETRVDRQIDLILLCITTGNYGPFHALVAHNVIQGADHWTTFCDMRNASRDYNNRPSENDLMHVSVNLVHNLEENFDKRVKEFQTLYKRNPTHHRLEQGVEELQQSIRHHHKQTFEHSRDQGKHIIRQLPAHLRDVASKLFTLSLDAPGTVIEEQDRSVKNIYNTVFDNPKRLPMNIQKAFASNKAAADVAVKWVRSLYHRRHFEMDDESDAGSDVSEMEELIADVLPDLDSSVQRLTFRKTELGWKISDMVR
ncbi:uncharacterized protein LTHEOB_10975 [Lasiodiplodia theobromae]|uniref:uncharacterized protein n=1 Tax=Lasiodiplodia theobromae TaxID=45133 RepID=UPI0015C32E72|nr:uncharacterized protein LTHEOB_10975 [Lasiodiplodia theobromae]KAF4538205.1 hypothetical protein LTHEOB_10975 [Lasiodiplodia theobromae]